jgi:hypothetical protein
MMNNDKVSVSNVINDALSVISKHPMIILIFFVPALIALIGGAAISGGAGVFGAFDEVQMEDGSFEIGDTFSIGTFLGAAALVSIVVSVISIILAV